MSGITKLWVTGRHRLYRTFSWRDGPGYPKNHKKLIATFDPETDKPVYNQYFIDLIKQQGIDINDILNMDWKNIPSVVNFGIFDPLTKTIKYKNNTIENKSDVNNNSEITLNLDSMSEIVDSIDKEINTTEKIRIIISNDNIVEFKVLDFTSKDYGTHLLLKQILEDTGLISILKDIFPNKWKEIATLACYIACNNTPLNYYKNWLENTVTYLDNYSDKYPIINELFEKITYNNTILFYESWAKYNIKDEYLALDISSLSSYSQLMNIVEPELKRDDENESPDNYCLLFAEKSNLPVFPSIYHGNINDVTSLPSLIDKFDLNNNFPYKLVLESNFYSLKTISIFLKTYHNYNFLISVPFITPIAKQIVSDGIAKFDKSHSFLIDNDIIVAYSFIQKLDNHCNLKYHVYYNELLYKRTYNNKMIDIISLQDQARTNPEFYKYQKVYKKYLIFDKLSDTNQYDITINHDILINELKNTGWMIIVGNELGLPYRDVINIYRTKYNLEKTFNRFKKSLDLKLSRVRINNNTVSKLFIGFIALIILLDINKKMTKNNLTNFYTLREIINSLNKIKLLSVNNKSAITAISKGNKELLSHFGIEIS